MNIQLPFLGGGGGGGGGGGAIGLNSKFVTHFLNQHNFISYLYAGNFVSYCCLFFVFSNYMVKVSIGTFS